MNRPLRRLLGLAFWCAMVVAAIDVSAPLRESSTTGQASLASYFAGPAAELRAFDLSQRLQLYDPVFWQDQDGNWSQVGYVKSRTVLADGNSLASEGGGQDLGTTVEVAWYADEIAADSCQLFYYYDSGSLQNVAATLFPPATQQRIQLRLSAAMKQHGEALARAFVPLVQQSLQRSIPIIEDEFRRSVRAHRGEIDQLADKWNREIVEQKLIPLARREIMPIVRKHGQPVAEKIGKELWDRASLWRFGWRAVYDKVPLPRRNLVRQEWTRFVDDEAVPVFEQHMDDIVTAIQRTLSDVSANKKVRSDISDVAEELVSDPATRQLVRQILKDALVDNDNLRRVWADIWSSPEARRALDMASDRLEPIVRQIGDEIFGSQEAGIDPNFARVLRSQILRKDRRWIVAKQTDEAFDGNIHVAAESMPYPMIYLATGTPTR